MDKTSVIYKATINDLGSLNMYGPIYISGPMSSDPDYRKKFDAVEEALIKAGYAGVINPARYGDIYEKEHPFPDGTPEVEKKLIRLKRDAALLSDCRSIIFLPRSEMATGCIAEYTAACALNMKIYTLSRNELNKILRGGKI